MTPSPSSSQRFEILDGMRGIAAIVVMLRHYFMYIDLKVGITPVFGNVTAAVDIFFMLSGFVIAHNYSHKLRDGMSFADYVYRRIIRLYPLFLFSVLFGVLTLLLFARIGETNMTAADIARSFFINAAFLPDLSEHKVTSNVLGYSRDTHDQIFPGNESLWSLHFEMLASLAFLWLFVRSTKFLIILTVASYLGLVLFGLFLNGMHFEAGGNTGSYLGGFPRVLFGFCAGIVVYRLRGMVPNVWIALFARIPYSSLFIYAAMVACFAMPIYIKGFYYLAQMLFFAPLIVLAGSYTEPQSSADGKLAYWLGWLSYPIYCLHLPMLRGLYYVQVEYGLFRQEYLIPFSIIASVLLSVVVTRYYEEPVRKYLGGLRHKKPRPS